MTVRLSQAFAAFRNEQCAIAQNSIQTVLVPEFNAEAEDIRRTYETESKDPAIGEALAMHRKRARILDLNVRKQQFIQELDNEMQEALTKRVMDYKGTIAAKTITEGDKQKEVLEAVFPDESFARVPKKLWVDYRQFQRV